MVRKISGKSQPTSVHHLKVDGNRIENPQDIANTIASTFSFNSSPQHLTKKFKTQQNKQRLDLHSDNSEPYNQSFSKMRYSRLTTQQWDLILLVVPLMIVLRCHRRELLAYDCFHFYCV
jgi:hypothetical protein